MRSRRGKRWSIPGGKRSTSYAASLRLRMPAWRKGYAITTNNLSLSTFFPIHTTILTTDPPKMSTCANDDTKKPGSPRLHDRQHLLLHHARPRPDQKRSLLRPQHHPRTPPALVHRSSHQRSPHGRRSAAQPRVETGLHGVFGQEWVGGGLLMQRGLWALAAWCLEMGQKAL